MSFLSSINVGVHGKREPHNLGGITTSTTELGYFQPTYCRYIVPDSHISIGARAICRLSPVSVPTIGQVSLRNYFYYVDLATLWTPFDAMKEGTNYRYGDGSITTPKAIPTFRLIDFFKSVMKFNSSADIPIVRFRESVVCTVYKDGTKLATGTAVGTAFSACMSYDLTQFPFLPYAVRQTNSNVTLKSSESSSSVAYATTRADLLDTLPLVVNTNADFSWTVTDGTDTYHILGKFTGVSKRVRKHFIGCGYSFNPFDDSRQTFLKLFADYKAWFDTMAVQRTINFNNTYCYNLIKYLSENAPLTYSQDSNTGKYYCNVYNTTYYSDTNLDTLINQFICSLSELCYNLPPDYFSASDITSVRGGVNSNNTTLTSVDVLDSINGNKFSRVQGTEQQVPYGWDSSIYGGNTFLNSRAIELAQTVLKWVNKRSVVGRKISELLALNGEKDIHNNEHEQVHHLGNDRINIDINPIFSQASTTDANLGDYAAVGYGSGQTDTFVYDTKVYGILLCLSAVVPVAGYFQGILRENGDSNPFEFFKTDFDALGYQDIAMNELISDLQFKTASGLNTIGTNLGFFGLAPRYQHLKVGRNIVNGDISIPSMQSVMLPYTLDRHFLTCVPVGSTDDFAEVSLPVNAAETFRQVKANDSYGDYNRIFQYTGSDYDHFILHFNFRVVAMSPMKSVANSYDTFQDGDDKALEFEHE